MSQEEWKHQQLQYIQGLPVRTVIIGENKQTIACDFEKQMAYFLDQRGLPTGRAAHLDKEKIEQLTDPSKQTNASCKKNPCHPEEKRNQNRAGKFLRKLAGGSDRKPKEQDSTASPVSSEKETQKSDTRRKAQMGRKKTIAAVLLVLTAAAVILSSVPEQSSLLTSESGGKASDTLETIDVIQVTEELIPGDSITPDNIQRVSIQAETYNQITLNQVSLYQWSRQKALLNAYAVQYIPRGQYLTYENVSTVYDLPDNPWGEAGQGNTFLTLPLDNKVPVNYGSILTLTIVKRTVQETGSPVTSEKQTPGIAGLEHKTSVEQSAVVDTYGLTNAVVCDLLNYEERSLYQTFTAWMAIPVGEQSAYIQGHLSQEKTSPETLRPKYAKIRVTEAQAKALGSLTEEGVTVQIALQKKEDIENDAKRLYAMGAKELMKTISSLTEELSYTEPEEKRGA